MPRLTVTLTALATALLLTGGAARAERIKDIVDIQGVRSNPLWGYGLVTGLSGTGDNSPASRRALANIVRRLGLVLSPEDLASKSIASVLVTAELPAFGRIGSRIDVTVSAIGNASSLQGGTLVMTPLLGADGNVYAVAQGDLSVGGFAASGQASSVTKNHTTVARIPNGAAIEREEIAEFVDKGQIVLQLRNPDFGTAQRIAEAVNALHPQSALAVDAGTVRAAVPRKFLGGEVAAFLDGVGSLQVKVDSPAVVIINERTGTIIVGENVRISTVAIAHGNLSIITRERDLASQPPPFARTGRTEKLHRTDIAATEENRALQLLEAQVSVAELVRALNRMGLTPRDLIVIFQRLREAGALQAELKIM